MSYFEEGAFLAVTDVFYGVGNDGCFFYMSKRLDFHVKQPGLMRNYSEYFDFKIRVKKLAALAFLQITDVISTRRFPILSYV